MIEAKIEALVEDVARLECAGDIAGAVKSLETCRLQPNDLATVALCLYRRDLSAVAFVITQSLLRNGMEHWILHALGAHLALRLGEAAAAEPSIKRLTELLGDADAAQRAAVRQLVEPFLPRDIVCAFQAGDRALNRAYAWLWSAIEPSTRERLAAPPPTQPSAIARVLESSDPGRLLRFASPSPDAPRVRRQVVLGIRHLWFPSDPNSRQHDLPPRFAAAFQAYGWQVTRHDLRHLQQPAIVAADYQALAALCRDGAADLLVLDNFMPALAAGAAGDIIRALRRERPDLRIVSIYTDPWLPENWDAIEAGADHLDGVWTLVVTPLLERDAFRGKRMLLPFLFGGSYGGAPIPLVPWFRFGGGVHYANWDRALWLAAMIEAGLPLSMAVSDHVDDKLDPLESFRAYMKHSVTGEAVLNFARRSNGVCTLTGRTFETLATGGLLVQERSDDIDQFLIAGEHYLRFETLGDLFAIAHLLKTEPERAEQIRRAGTAFFEARYSDDKVIGYIDHFLFHRGSARVAA